MSFLCPDCSHKISKKDWDAEFEMYECPSCEGLWQLEELVANGAKTAAGNGSGSHTEAQRAIPKAKGKIRQELLDSDAQADAKQIEEITSNVKTKKKEERHRDEIQTGLVLNVIADEIQAIYEEAGLEIDRTNAREFFAMNLYRPLLLGGARAREQDVPHKLCKEHS